MLSRWKNKDKFTYSTLKLLNGKTLNVATIGNRNKTAILLFGGIGTPAILFEPLTNLLRKDFFLITWSYRGLFDNEQILDSIDDHIEDVLAITAHFGIEKFNGLSFCSGCKVLLRFNQLYPQQLLTLVIINANVTKRFMTSEQEKLIALLSYTAKNPDDIVQSYEFLLQTIDKKKVAECPLQTELALPYQNGPDLLLTFAKNSLIIINTEVELEHLMSQKDSIYLVIDQNSQLADKRNTLEVLADYTENPIISIADSGHHSLYHSQSVQRNVAEIFLTANNNITKTITR